MTSDKNIKAFQKSFYNAFQNYHRKAVWNEQAQEFTAPFANAVFALWNDAIKSVAPVYYSSNIDNLSSSLTIDIQPDEAVEGQVVTCVAKVTPIPLLTYTDKDGVEHDVFELPVVIPADARVSYKGFNLNTTDRIKIDTL